MQLAAAGLFVIEAVYSVVVSLLFINPDNMRRAILNGAWVEAGGSTMQATTLPPGGVDTILNIAIVSTIVGVVVIAILELVAAAGSYLGWRWMFWAALVLFGFGGLGAGDPLGDPPPGNPYLELPTLFKRAVPAALAKAWAPAAGTFDGYFNLSATSPVPLPDVLVSELLSILSLAMFIWMLIGVIKFGPWAMKKPGA
jgi:hypothetical protein